MSGREVSVVRTALAGHERVLRELLTEYFREANSLGREWFDDEEFGAPVPDIVDADVERLETAELAEPLFLARHDGQILGTVQLKHLDETTAEVKRLYVRPDSRGEGVGRALVEALVEETRRDGFESLRLGVAPYHEGARRLYESLGFQYTPPYEESNAPAEIHDVWNFMEYAHCE